MTRFFVDAPLAAGLTLPLPRDLSHHATRALRLRDGAAVTLFNGQGGEYHGHLSLDAKSQASVVLSAFEPREAELPFAVTIAQGLSGGDKMDWTIEKAVELGAAAIQPLACERSVVRLSGERAAKRLQHWEALVRAACTQCGRNRLPRVHAPAGLGEWLSAQRMADSALRLLLSPRGERPLATMAAPPPGQPVILLIGPEGGFSPEEESAAAMAGFIPVTMGPRILRTETAAAAALATLAARWEG